MSRNLPDVTVVVPMLNAGETIGEQLQALADQWYGGVWEVVVADNGSTDDSAERAGRCGERFERFQVVAASEIKGVSHARNVGAAVGKGEVILFTDADDVVCPGWMGALVDALQDSDVVGGPLDEETINPEYAREWGDPPIPTDRLNVVADYLPNARGNNMGIKRSVFEALGGWNEDYRFAEDVEFSWRAVNAGYRLTFVPSAVVHYRRRNSIGGLARQQYFRGRQTHRLQFVHDFGHLGYHPESDASEGGRAIGWILRNAPASVFDRSKRGIVVGKLSYGLGWAVGIKGRRRALRELQSRT